MWTANYDFKWNVGSQQHWKDLLFCSFPSPESKSSQPYSLFLVSVIRTVLTVRLGGGSNLMSLNLWVLPHKFKVKGRFPGGWNISSWQCPHQQTKNLGNIRSDTRRRIKRLLLVQEPVWALHNNARSFWQLCCLPLQSSSPQQSTSELQWSIYEFMWSQVDCVGRDTNKNHPLRWEAFGVSPHGMEK